MIIVSQDKRKTTENLDLEIFGYTVKCDGSSRTIAGFQILDGKSKVLGEYKTEERAKEVLQEIANTYTKIGIEFETFNGGKQQLLPIYEMPEE